MQKKILIIGSLNMDMDIFMKRMPEPGETVMGENITYIPGGKGANQACAAGKMCGNVSMLGCIGKDEFGAALKDNLEKAGVDVSHLAVREGETTGMAIIYIDDAGNNHIVVVPGANRTCNLQYLKENEELIEEADYVVFQMEIPYETIFYGIKRAKALGKTVILNPAPAPGELPEEIWGMIDYLTPNEKELMCLVKSLGNQDLIEKTVEETAGKENTREQMKIYRDAAEKLLDKGVKNVLVTLGDQGALLLNREKGTVIPARKVQAVDTTAAGDCFHGAFLVGLSEGMEPEEAVRMANLASSIAVTKKGAQSSLPERAQVRKLM